jgi:hypothetical protein
MSDPVRPETEQVPPQEAGPNLTLFYSLIALALVAAITVALMIVLPFHHRH